MFCQLSPRSCEYPNEGMGGCLLARILILLQTLSFHFVYVTGSRQFTKVVSWAFSLGTVDPSSFPFQDLEWTHSVKVFLFPAGGDDTHRISRAYSCTILWYGMPDSLNEPGSGPWVHRWHLSSLILASCIKFFVRLPCWGPCLYFPSGRSFLAII